MKERQCYPYISIKKMTQLLQIDILIYLYELHFVWNIKYICTYHAFVRIYSDFVNTVCSSDIDELKVFFSQYDFFSFILRPLLLYLLHGSLKIVCIDHFHILGHSDFDLWPTDQKSINDLLLTLTNHPSLFVLHKKTWIKTWIWNLIWKFQ